MPVFIVFKFLQQLNALFQDGKRVAKNREYYTYVGKWKGKQGTY